MEPVDIVAEPSRSRVPRSACALTKLNGEAVVFEGFAGLPWGRRPTVGATQQEALANAGAARYGCSMRTHLYAASLCVALAACGSATTPERGPVVTIDAATPPPRASSPQPATPPPPAAASELPLFLVGEIYSLIDLWPTDDGKIELRLGIDMGGGTLGHFRYVQLAGGKPDFETETTEMHFADTSNMGAKMLAGSRPELLYHSVSGFRSGPSDNPYFVLRDGTWTNESVSNANGISIGMYRWTKARILEVRNPDPQVGVFPRVPEFRVLRGADKDAPAVPRALATRLEGEDFFYDAMRVFPSGEVLVVGKRIAPDTLGMLGMLLWRDQLKQPTYLVSNVEGVSAETEVAILGGSSLAELRLRVDSRVVRFDGEKLVVESTIAAGKQPDVWFGAPLVREEEKAAFVRLAAKGPWISIPVSTSMYERSIVVDGAGVVWKAEEGKLYASVRPQAPPFQVTEEALVARRKASVRLGGSSDATGEEPAPYNNSKCRMHYVLLDDSPEATASQDYPAHRAALKGHRELGAVKLVVSRERGRQYFGALTDDYELGRKLESLIAKRVKASRHEILCAEPAGAVELRFDWATGKATL